jgi:hypothetical protein
MIKPVEFAAGHSKNGGTGIIETVANILEREVQHVIAEWLMRVEKEPDLMLIPLNHEERTGHLPRLLHDVIKRLRLLPQRKPRSSGLTANAIKMFNCAGEAASVLFPE